MITVAPYNDTVLLCCQRRCLSLWHALRESLSFSFVTFENLSCSYWFNVIFLFCSSSFFFFLHLLLLLPPLPLPPPPPPSSSSSSFLLLLPLSTPLCAPPSPAPLVSLIFFSSFFFLAVNVFLKLSKGLQSSPFCGFFLVHSIDLPVHFNTLTSELRTGLIIKRQFSHQLETKNLLLSLRPRHDEAITKQAQPGSDSEIDSSGMSKYRTEL